MSKLLRFKHQIGDPLVDLIKRSAENVIIEPGASDVLAMARRLTIELAHFYEAETGGRLQTGIGSPISELHEKLVDAADTIKHGKLRASTRQTAFVAVLEFDVRGSRYRYFRTAIWAKSDRFGEYDLIETLTDYSLLLARIMKIDWQKTFSVPEQPFSETAVILIGDKNPDPQEIKTNFYEFDEAARERRQLDRIPAGFSLRIENRSGKPWTFPTNSSEGG